MPQGSGESLPQFWATIGLEGCYGYLVLGAFQTDPRHGVALATLDQAGHQVRQIPPRLFVEGTYILIQVHLLGLRTTTQ